MSVDVEPHEFAELQPSLMERIRGNHVLRCQCCLAEEVAHPTVSWIEARAYGDRQAPTYKRCGACMGQGKGRFTKQGDVLPCGHCNGLGVARAALADKEGT